MFHSNSETHPWLQIKLEAERMIEGVVIVNRKKDWGQRLANLEIRAGNSPLPYRYSGYEQIDINTVGGFFEGPGASDETYEIKFDTPIRANFITLQQLNSKYLQIVEVYLPGGEFFQTYCV